MVQGSRQEASRITSEQRTEPKVLGCAGFARYREIECRYLPEQEWYRRGFCAFVS